MDLPVGDTFKMNVTGLYASRDGYVKSLDSKPMGNVNRYAARGTILWTPDPDLKISLTGDFSHIDERALPGVLLGLVPNIHFTPVPRPIPAASNLQAANSAGGPGGNERGHQLRP